MAKVPQQTITEFATEIGCTPAHVGRVAKRIGIELDSDPSDKRRRLIPRGAKRARLVTECLKNVHPITDAPSASAAIDGEIVEVQPGAMGQLIRVDFGQVQDQTAAIAAIVDDVAAIFGSADATTEQFATRFIEQRYQAGVRLGAAGIQAMAAGVQAGEAQGLQKRVAPKPAAAKTYTG